MCIKHVHNTHVYNTRKRNKYSHVDADTHIYTLYVYTSFSNNRKFIELTEFCFGETATFSSCFQRIIVITVKARRPHQESLGEVNPPFYFKGDKIRWTIKFSLLYRTVATKNNEYYSLILYFLCLRENFHSNENKRTTLDLLVA